MIEDIILFNVDVSNFTKNDLRDYLKKDASTLSIYEIMSATNAIREDGKYVQASYREIYIQSYDGSLPSGRHITGNYQQLCPPIVSDVSENLRSEAGNDHAVGNF